MWVRSARADDLARIRDIYNGYVEHSPATFDIDQKSLEERESWFAGFADEGIHRLLVIECEGRVDGFASSVPFAERAAYDRSVTTSIYLAAEACSSGLGTALYDRLMTLLEEEPLAHRAYAGITLPNEASIALHRRFGFKRIATYSEVGFKFGRYWDVAWFERAL